MIFYCSVVSMCLTLPRQFVVSQLLLPELPWRSKSDQTCSVKSEKERSLIRLTGHMNWFSGRFKTYQEERSHTFQEKTILSSFFTPLSYRNSLLYSSVFEIFLQLLYSNGVFEMHDRQSNKPYVDHPRCFPLKGIELRHIALLFWKKTRSLFGHRFSLIN